MYEHMQKRESEDKISSTKTAMEALILQFSVIEMFAHSVR